MCSLKQQRESDKDVKNIDRFLSIQTPENYKTKNLYVSSYWQINSTYHVFEASQHCSRNDAQKEGHDVEDGGGP